MNYELWQWCFATPVLLLESITDIKSKKVHGIIISGLIVIVVTVQILVMKQGILFSLMSIVPGVLMILAAQIFKGSIGSGDGVMMAFVGSVVGVGPTVMIVTVATIVAAVYSIILMLVKKVGKDYRISFVPFILMGFLVMGVMK